MQEDFLKYTVHVWKPPEESIFHLLTSSSGSEITEKKKEQKTHTQVDDYIY